MDLRTLQDWNVRLLLRTAAGVDDVTSWGGDEKQYQVLIQPHKLIKYGISFKTVMEALAANNRQVGGQYVNLGREQYLVRGLGPVSYTHLAARAISRPRRAAAMGCSSWVTNTAALRIRSAFASTSAAETRPAAPFATMMALFPVAFSMKISAAPV